MKPEPNITLPCEVISVHDGDTLSVDVIVRANVRLLDCWAKELREEGGPFARNALAELALGRKGVIQIPLLNADNLADLLTFGRVLAKVWVDGSDKDLSSQMVERGLAMVEKKQ